MFLQVEMIPNEFETWADYTNAFRNPTLVEIWHQIDLGMDTIFGGLYVDFYEDKQDSSWPNVYNIKLKVPKRGGGDNMPKKGDLMLLSELNSRDQIIKNVSFCTILEVMKVNTYDEAVEASMDVWLSQSPYGSINEQSSYQVMRLTNLATCECSCEVMMRDSKASPQISNLILTKNNGADRECGRFADKAKIAKAVRADFELNESQSDAVASCISATKCSEKCSVHLIWGPPGTGKTKTVSMILQKLLMTPSKSRSLVCAPTNIALLQLASHLVSLLEKSTETSPSTDDIIMFGSEKLTAKTYKDLSKILLRDHVAGNLEMKKYSMHTRENIHLQDAKLVICTPFKSSRLKNQRFDILVIDEAPNLKECESMIPLTIDGIKYVVLVGDDNQLELVVMSPARTARDGHFWTTEQEDMYNNVYKMKSFADSTWINWKNINHSKEMDYVERRCLDIGLHKLMGTRQDWHEEIVRQFFTVYINPNRTSLTWMSGINRKITINKRFCENVLLDPPLQHSKFCRIKIEDSLGDTEQKELDSYRLNDGDVHFSAATRLLRKTIYPRAGDKGEVHNDNLVIFCSGSLSTL
ncbi:hypothetical protein C2845_PM06G25820 [Panicum miliaceum]|uniref:DNA2/NAM7 helicase helicase domain-containing protein n=1 Tax=Panicum miliaceum TaxID=4540 RepID=A0A3L6RCB3_PANMI|nr:hypothetical protein C2845_PM06G25820 [Panicum miliaceum]